MKFLCVSDQIDPVVYSNNAKDRFNDIDAVLCAGDLPMDYIDFIVSTLNKPTFFVFGNHNLKEYSYYHRSSADMRLTPNALKENFDTTATYNHSHGADYIGFKVQTIKNLKIKDSESGKETPLLIAGISGSIKYNNGINQFSDSEMKLKLLKMMPKLIFNKIRYGRYLDILLTHASPRHIHDKEDPCHKGFECFNWFIKRFSPKYLVHGHIHLYDSREQRITETDNGCKVVNAYAYHVIEL